MFHDLRAQPNDLARYVYLITLLPQTTGADRVVALQMIASIEDELGLYNEAIGDFPLKSHIRPDGSLPLPADWKATSAINVVEKLAASRQLVLINEAHHDAHTRQLTLELLPRMRALGFDYFAVEALGNDDPKLATRGYPIQKSGSMYLHEPTYGDIVRQAIKLGFKIVAYDEGGSSNQSRETVQAQNLYNLVFAKDPSARLFVHSGYAHIDKAQGRLGSLQPMAMKLQQLSGIEPLSIDQTQFREQVPSEKDAYTVLTEGFPVDGPTVLVNKKTGNPWSAYPDRYDVNVLLPPMGEGTIQSRALHDTSIAPNTLARQSMLEHQVEAQRPTWLTLNGERLPYRISAKMCKVIVPCVVDVHPVDEPNDAIPVDRYTFLHADGLSKLYLCPGNYRLRAWDVRGKTLYEQTIWVK